MTLDNAPLLLGISLGGLTLAMVIYRSLLAFVTQPEPRALPDIPAPGNHQPVFLFDGSFLVDATPSAADLIANRPPKITEHDALMSLLERQFPKVQDDLDALTDDTQSKVLTSDNLGLTVTLERRSGMTRIALGGPDTQDHTHFAEIERAAQVEELALLRNLTDNAPQMIWQENDDGELLWANSAYLQFSDQLAAAAEKSKIVWPIDQVFRDIPKPSAGSLSPTQCRFAVKRPDGAGEYWFDITTIPQAGAVLHYAVNASEAVQAEVAKRTFQQTLSKTFAQLSTGLAIFDRDRKLAVFNPAMLDLTGLPVEFLSTRPSIRMVLDRLRDAGRLPEPKDYATWRQQFNALEAAAENGDYCETWDLPDGQTFRVTGRPHPDGALAFVFEDISAEVLLTRRFRTEIETSQAVLDSLPEAIAVFSSAGTLVMTNSSYDDMWGLSDMDAVIGPNLRSSIRTWKSKSVPSRIWSGIETAALQATDRSAWSDTITLQDGRHIMCKVDPITGGMTLVNFQITTAASPVLRKVAMGDQVPRLAKS